MSNAREVRNPELCGDGGDWLPTADVYDRFGAALQSCETQFRNFGGRTVFGGRIRTIRCFRDNGMLKELVKTQGDGSVLVVDGGGSLASALLGDMIAASAVANGWAGVIIYGAVRDSVALAGLDLGVKALGSNPRKSAKKSAGELDVDLAFGEARFTPGSWLVADADGVLTLPA